MTIDQATVARRVNALLRKAESSTHEAEAVAFAEKAAQLIARFQIDEAMLAAEQPETGPAPILRKQVIVKGTYLARRTHLYHCVSQALGLKAISVGGGHNGKQIVEAFGTAADLEWWETLSVSLSEQMDAAMKAAKGEKHYAEHGRTFNAAFVQAYSNRVYQRLLKAVAIAKDGARNEQKTSTSMALVLASKAERIEQEYRAAYPRATYKRIAAVASYNGRRAGASAAERASFARGSVGGSSGRLALC